jgi:hypothetical protein
LNAYFGPRPLERRSVEGGTQRLAGKNEVLHLALLASRKWEREWKARGRLLKESITSAMFFEFFKLDAGEIITTLMYVLTLASVGFIVISTEVTNGGLSLLS